MKQEFLSILPDMIYINAGLVIYLFNVSEIKYLSFDLRDY